MPRSTDLNENQVETLCCHFLRSKQIFFWKNHTGGYFDAKIKKFRKQESPWAINGAPDIIAVIDGRFIGLEMKATKGKQSDPQKEFEAKLKKAGGHYYVVNSLSALQTIFAAWKSLGWV